MNTSYKFLFNVLGVIFASALLLSGCDRIGPAPGSYSTASVTSPTVIEAANHAIQEANDRLHKTPATASQTIALTSIISARSQVVAGFNYDLQLGITINGAAKTAHAIVWRKIGEKPTFELTTWEVK